MKASTSIGTICTGAQGVSSSWHAEVVRVRTWARVKGRAKVTALCPKLRTERERELGRACTSALLLCGAYTSALQLCGAYTLAPWMYGSYTLRASAVGSWTQSGLDIVYWVWGLGLGLGPGILTRS